MRIKYEKRGKASKTEYRSVYPVVGEWFTLQGEGRRCGRHPDSVRKSIRSGRPPFASMSDYYVSNGDYKGEWLDVDELAHRLGCSDETVRKKMLNRRTNEYVVCSVDTRIRDGMKASTKERKPREPKKPLRYDFSREASAFARLPVYA